MHNRKILLNSFILSMQQYCTFFLSDARYHMVLRNCIVYNLVWSQQVVYE
jgi:hypothetical protein